MAANTTNLSELTRKHRQLRGLSEFYRCLYADWDMFMTQFYDPDRQQVSLNSAGDTDKYVQNRQTRSNSRCQQSTAAAATTDSDNAVVRATASKQPAVASGVECVTEISATNSDTGTTRPLPKAPESAIVISGQADTERGEVSAAEDVTMTTSRRASRLRSAVAVTDTQVLLDVKPVGLLDGTFHSDCRKPAVEESSYVESVNDDIKPVAGLPVKRRRTGRQTDSTDIGQRNHNVGNRSSAADDCRPRRRKRSVSVASVERCATPRDSAIVKRRSERTRKDDVSGVDDNSGNEDIKPVIGTVQGRKGRKWKKSTVSAGGKMTGAENTVNVEAKTALPRFEEQDVKPDLSSLSVTVASADPGVKRRRAHSRKNGINSQVKNIEAEAIGSVERSRKCRKAKQSRPSVSHKTTKRKTENTAEVDGERTRTRFEEQDVKPDLSSLSDATVAAVDTGVKRGDDVSVKRRRGRPRKIGIDSEDKNTKSAVVGSVKRRRKCKKPKQLRLGAVTGTKNSVEVDRGISFAWFEQQDVKPNLTSLNAVAVVKKRSKRKWGSPWVVTRSMYRARQLSSVADDIKPAVSGPRCTESPPFTLLTPSQIKVEIES